MCWAALVCKFITWPALVCKLHSWSNVVISVVVLVCVGVHIHHMACVGVQVAHLVLCGDICYTVHAFMSTVASAVTAFGHRQGSHQAVPAAFPAWHSNPQQGQPPHGKRVYRALAENHARHDNLLLLVRRPLAARSVPARCVVSAVEQDHRAASKVELRGTRVCWGPRAVLPFQGWQRACA